MSLGDKFPYGSIRVIKESLLFKISNFFHSNFDQEGKSFILVLKTVE